MPSPRLRSREHRRPAEALDERWRWLEAQASQDAVVRQQALEMLEDAAEAEARVRQDYTGRYPLELLQNAHDACADAGHVGAVHFVVRPTALLVANEGVPFTYERVKSLLRLGASEKREDRNRRRLIGYKGIGFSSVFEICDRPQIIGTELAFGFDPELAEARVYGALGARARRLPIRSFAHRIDESVWSEDRRQVARLLDRGAVTVVRLPLLAGISVEDIEKTLGDTITPEALLFMPFVREIRMSGPNLRFAWTRHRGRRRGKGVVIALRSTDGQQRSWLLRENTIPVERAVIESVSERLRDDSWVEVRRLKVAVALPWRRGKTDPSVGSQRLHVYFPTDDVLGRAVLVHGDFYVQSSRRRIEDRGPGGAISSRVAHEAAKLVAELAESIAWQGNPLLRALAPRDDVDGFGHRLGELIDEQLSQARIVRSARGSLRTPGSVRRLDVDLGARDEEMLSELAGTRPDLLHPGDAAAEASDLLDGLDVEVLEPEELAGLLDASRSRLNYARLAGLLVRWLESLPGYERRQTVERLRAQPVLQDAHGRWSKPNELVVRSDNTVRVPKGLERREVSRPPGRYGRRLLELLDLPVLDAANAVRTIVSAVNEGTFGIRAPEARDVLRFLTEVWDRDPAQIEGQAGLGAIRLPTKTAKRTRASWRRADETYFSSSWLGDGALESLYGRFDQSEFLAAAAPREPRRRASRRRFFETLGVASAPRLKSYSSYPWRPGRPIRIEDEDSWRGLRRAWEWQELPEFEHFECPAQHPESLSLSGTIADRLDDVLASDLTLRLAESVAVALSRAGHPYGSQAEIRCRHSAHPGHLVKRVPGYQRWLLEHTEWVPVSGDPARARYRCPGDAWVDISPRDAWLALPRVRLPKEVRGSFEFASALRPRADALERALEYLAQEFDEPDRAPEEIRKTARWLLERLDRALLRGSKSVERPSFLCRSGGTWGWHTEPLVADLPGLEAFDGLPLLPPGGWRGLRAAYGLKRASEAVQIAVRPRKRVRGTGLLDTQSRVSLLAALIRHGCDHDRAARRLAMIRTLPVAGLSIELSLDGARSRVERPFHLEVARSPRRVTAARLYYSPGETINLKTLGRDVADLLEEPELAQLVALVLRDADEVLADEAIGEDELAEARRLLEAARRRAKIPEEDELDVFEPALAGESSEEATPADVEVRPPTAADQARDGRPTDPARAVEREGVDQAVRSGASGESEAPARKLISARAGFGQVRSGRRRQRPTRERRPPRMTGVPGPGALGEADAETEERAMKIVERYGREILGADVYDVHAEKKGWDLEFRHPDGSWEFVEVKGTSGEAPFSITRNECRAASDEEIGPRYVLYWVANAAVPRQAEIRKFPAIGLHLTEDVLRPLQWEVWDWSALPYQVIPLEDDSE